MRERDEDELGLRDWAVPPAPADLVERVMTQVEVREDTSVGAPPRFAPVDPAAAAGSRRFGVGAVIAAALLGAAAAAAAVAVVYERGDDGGATEAARGDERVPAPAPVAPRPDDRPDYTVPQKDAPPPPTETRRFASPAERRAAWERLVAARALREAGVGGGAGGGAAGGGGAAEVKPEEIRASVNEVVPLLAECFEMASEAVQKAGGTAKMKLVVGSEPEVGTLIEDVSFLEGTPEMLADPDFTECMTETLMSVEMPPLEAGGQLVIHYPFTFSMDEAATGGGTAEQLADQAANAARAGEYGKALRLAEESLARGVTQPALTTAAIAACNLKEADKAKRYVAKLSGQRQGMVRQVCLRNNVSID